MSRQLSVIVFQATNQSLYHDKPINQRDFFKATTIDDDLQVFYDIIGCECIDIVKRKIGDNYYNIICDDEGLFVEKPIISLAHPTDMYQTIHGNVIITGIEDENGNLTSLTKIDIVKIKSSLKYLIMLDEITNDDTISPIILLS